MARIRFVPIILLLAIHAAFLFPLFQPGLYQSHDGEALVARFAAYYKAFAENMFPPRWAGDLNFHYGSPVLNFYYPLPGYIASFLHIFNISFQDTYKILIGLAFITAPVGIYLWLRHRVNKKTAFVGALLYGLTPYHFLNLYVRGDIGELVALVFLPLVLLSIDKRNIIVGGITYGFFILSHNGVSLMFTPVLLGYSLFFTNNNIQRLKNLILLAIGLSFSAFFWIPALVELRFTLRSIVIDQMFKDHFPTFLQLVYSPWGFGPDVKKIGGLSPQIGPLLLFLVLVSLGILVRLKKKNMMIFFWLIVFLAGIFISLPVSTPLWTRLPILPNFQFPWRFSAITSFAAVAIIAHGLTMIKNRIVFIVIAITSIIFAIPMVRVSSYVNYSDVYYDNYPATTNYHSETTTIWSDGDPATYPKQPVEIISGDGKVTDFTRSTIHHTFTTNALSPINILDNTFYYPGWRVQIDSNTVPIQFQDPNHRGLITFSVPSGSHAVSVRFGETSFRKIADAISIFTIVSLVFLWFFRYKLGKRSLIV